MWFSSVQLLSCVWLFAWTEQFSCSCVPAPGACSNLYPLSWWCHPTISSCHVLLLLPPIFPSIRVFSKESVLCITWSKYWSFSFTISISNEYSGQISFRIDWLDLLAVRGTQETSPTLQFKNLNSLALSFLYSPTLTSIHDYWKNHRFDYMDLYWQSIVSVF